MESFPQEAANPIYWILELAVILLSAKLGAEIFNRLKQSPMLGEILAGVIIGPSVLSLFHESTTLTTFAEIGIIFMIRRPYARGGVGEPG